MAAPTKMRNTLFRVAVYLCRPELSRGFIFRKSRMISSIRHELHLTSQMQSLSRPFSITTNCWSIESDGEGKDETVKIKTELTDAEVEEGIAYIHSADYVEKYGNRPVWTNYRRNFKGQVPRLKTRLNCIKGPTKMAGNPCPLCRDQSLVVHHKNVKLLNQFVNQDSWLVFQPQQTGLCQKSHKRLTAAIDKARNYGLMPFTVPFVQYRYDEYYPKDNSSSSPASSSS